MDEGQKKNAEALPASCFLIALGLAGIATIFFPNWPEMFKIKNNNQYQQTYDEQVPEYEYDLLDQIQVGAELARPYKFYEDGHERGTYIVVGDARQSLDAIVEHYEEWRCSAIKPFELYTTIKYLSNGTNMVTEQTIRSVQSALNRPVEEYIIDYIIEQNRLNTRN